MHNAARMTWIARSGLSFFRRHSTWTTARTCMLERLPPVFGSDVRRIAGKDNAHWSKQDRKGRPTRFKNPWRSFDRTGLGLWRILSLLLFHPPRIPVPKNIEETYRVVEPKWHDFDNDKVRATWIGHATFLLELPKVHPAQRRGLRILFDPVFTEYTAPSWARKLKLGPHRYSRLPCRAEDLPEIDIIAISHNHYDHLDEVAIQHLERATGGTMQYLVGLNSKHTFASLGVAKERVHEMDWWECGRLTCEGLRIPQKLLGENDSGEVSITIHCLPSQHNSARSLIDQNRSLWCSWLVETPATPYSEARKVYFAGDTGYMSTPGDDRYLPSPTTAVDRHEKRAKEEHTASAASTATIATRNSSALTSRAATTSPIDDPTTREMYPRCPVFAQIGRHFGELDLCMIPIGLYSPRSTLSPVHLCPEDAVDVHRDLRSKLSIACHFATFRGGLSRNFEDVTEPPKRLKAYMRAMSVPASQFRVLDIGGSAEA